MTDDIVLQAVAALKAGNKIKARELLVTAIKQNTNNELAWSWMFSLVDTDEQRIHCLKEVLRINPSNLKASQALDKLASKYTQPPSFEDFVQGENKPTTSYVGPSVQVSTPHTTVQSTPVDPVPTLAQRLSGNLGDVSPRDPAQNVPTDPTRAPKRTIPTNPVPAPVQNVSISQETNLNVLNENISSSKFTPKRIISSIGLLLIIAASFVTWEITNKWAGIFYPGKYRQIATAGVDTMNGLISAGAAVFGIILLFAINEEKKAHSFCSLCAIISAISAIVFLGEANSTGPANNFADFVYFDYFNKPGVGLYMAIIGSIIVLGCFLMRSRD